MVKIAIIHDWLVDYAGSEKVLSEIINIYPDADLFCLVDHMKEDIKKDKLKVPKKTTFIQNLPFSKKHFRKYLPLFPFAIEQINLSEYDVIISSSHAVSKGVITGPDQLHICYCHSPIRYAWDFQGQYLKDAGLDSGVKGLLTRYILYCIRNWDSRTANGVDYFIANSNYIGRRINKVYRRSSTTIYPNVAVEDFTLQEQKEEFYLTASRLVSYKKIKLIVECFANLPEKKLVVIGNGPQYELIKSIATSNVLILGHQPFEILKDYMQKAKAFIFASEEDFGIVPVEAQACGTPVIAYKKGGAIETIEENISGIFFKEQTVNSISKAIYDFEKNFITDSKKIRANAEKFSTDNFKSSFKEFVDSKIFDFFGVKK